MTVRKGFRFRIYPNTEQESRLAVQFGHTRFVYNHYLALRSRSYEETGKHLTYTATAGDLVRLKAEAGFDWLREADSQVLQQALMDLQRAFNNYFHMWREGTLPSNVGKAPRKDGQPRGYPRFKSKHHVQSVRYPQRFKLNAAGNRIYLPKVGGVKVVVHRPLEGVMKNCTVSKAKSGKYFVSIQCEIEGDEPKPRTEEPAVGIDLGLMAFITTSEGEKIAPPKYLRRAERRLKLRQRQLSRKAKGSRNREKARRRVALQHERVANQRRDFHHQLSRKLVDDFGHIAFEDLNIRGMLGNHALAKSIQDAGWGQFIRFCEYKQAWAGGTTSKADRFFPSSKACSVCRGLNHGMTLSDREWVCLECGAVHDRDENAAINILKVSTAGAAESHASGDMSLVGGSAQEAQALYLRRTVGTA